MVGRLVKVKSDNNRLGLITEQRLHRTYYMLYYIKYADGGKKHNNEGTWAMLKDLEVICK